MPLLDRLPALGYRDYRVFQSGNFVSNVGTMIQAATISWHVYNLTGSSFAVGMLGICRVIPLMGLSLFGGIIADQFDRRRVLFVTTLTMATIACALAMLTLTNQITVLWLYAIVVLTSAARAFNNPSRQALVVNLVPREVVPNAVSVNGILWRLADVIGPIVAGALIGSAGLGSVTGLSLCYIVNFLSFFAVLVSLFFLPSRPTEGEVERITSVAGVFSSLGEGFRFFWRNPIIRQTIVIDFWATFFSAADALLPALSEKILKLGPEGYGLLLASSGIGALLAAIFMAWMPTIHKQGVWVLRMIAIYGLATILLGLSTNLWMAVIFLAATGAADMISTVLRQTIRQLATPDYMRGRLAGTSMIFQIGGPQLGDFESGTLAAITGERAAIVIGGSFCVLIAGIYNFTGKALRTYRHE